LGSVIREIQENHARTGGRLALNSRTCGTEHQEDLAVYEPRWRLISSDGIDLSMDAHPFLVRNADELKSTVP